MAEREAIWVSPAQISKDYYDFFKIHRLDTRTIHLLASKNLLIKSGKADDPEILLESWQAFTALFNYHLDLQKAYPRHQGIAIPAPDFLQKNAINYLLLRDAWYCTEDLLNKEDKLRYYKIFSQKELHILIKKKIIMGYYCSSTSKYFVYYPAFLDILTLRNINLDYIRFNSGKCR